MKEKQDDKNKQPLPFLPVLRGKRSVEQVTNTTQPRNNHDIISYSFCINEQAENRNCNYSTQQDEPLWRESKKYRFMQVFKVGWISFILEQTHVAVKNNEPY